MIGRTIKMAGRLLLLLEAAAFKGEAAQSVTKASTKS
jgi:hypothetical protein